MTDDPGANRTGRSWAAGFADIRLWVVLVGFIVVLGGSWIVGSRLTGPTADLQLKAGARAGFIAPDFSLQTLDGKVMSLSAQRQSVVLINLWASWCGPCRGGRCSSQRVWKRICESRGWRFV